MNRSAIDPHTLDQYRVLLHLDRWDDDADRKTVIYRAFGQLDATLQAREDYPAASVLQVERLEPDGAA